MSDEEVEPSFELKMARAALIIQKSRVRNARKKYREALAELKVQEISLKHAEDMEPYYQKKLADKAKVLDRHQQIANIRACPYCTAEQGELCWNASAYLYGKEEKAHYPHPERGDLESEYPKEKYSRPPIQKFGYYGGWNPYGIK